MINLPNALSLSRIVFLFIVVVLLLADATGTATGAFVLFVVASITDWLDGYIARRYNMISTFGKLIDALADKVLVVGMFVVLLAVDLIPAWTVILILIILSREFLITGLRLVAAAKGRVLAAEKAGKLKTVIQIICLCVFLLEYALIRDGASMGLEAGFIEPAADVLYSAGMILLFVATLLTASSGAGYMIRYADLLREEDAR